MNLTAPQRAAVSSALARGASAAGELLAKATGRPWAVETEVLSDGPADRFRLFLGGTIQPHFGVLMTEAGELPLGLLVLFPSADALLVASGFAAKLGLDPARVPNLEIAGVAELSNIVAHALIGPLADALGLLVVLTPPPSVSLKTRLDHFEGALERFAGKDCFVMAARLSLKEGADAVECHVALIVDRAALAGRLVEAAA